jgi:hypothetical protein
MAKPKVGSLALKNTVFEGQWMTNKFRTIVVVAALLALSGCAEDKPVPAVDSERSGSTMTFSDGLLTYVPMNVGKYRVGMTAEFSGTLSLETGCLSIENEPLAFPREETTWDGTTLVVDGKEFVVGDEITVGGGGGFDDVKLPENTPDQCGGVTPFYVAVVEAK